MKKPVLKVNQEGNALIIGSTLAILAIIGIDAWIRHHARPSGEAWPASADVVERWSVPCKPGEFLTSSGACKTPLEPGGLRKAAPSERVISAETKCVVSTTYPPTTTCEAPHDPAPTP